MENENVIIILMMEKQQAGFIKTSKIGGSLFCAHCSVYGSSFFSLTTMLIIRLLLQLQRYLLAMYNQVASGFKHTRPSSTCAVKTSSFVALISLLLNLRRCIIHLYLLVNSYETFDDIKPKLRCAYRCKSFQTAKRGEVCRIPGCSVSPAAPGTPTPVRLPQAPPETFKQFLLYVYTGKVRI